MSPPRETGSANSRIEQALLRETKAEADKIFSDLFESGEPRPTLPEELFVNVFLPVFSQQIKDTEKLNITTRWVGVAGSAMSEVDVTDAQGKVLFTVPPLMSSDFLRLGDRRSGRTFTEVFQEAQLQHNRLPILGVQALIDGTDAVISSREAPASKTHVEQWDAIFARYNIGPKGEKKTSAAGSGAPTGNQDDELNYD